MNNRDIWLEVALNGPFGRRLQPNIPVTPEEIIADGIACAKAGATIVHLHAYDERGRPVEDVDIYARILDGIREAVDVLVYPTIGFPGTTAERLAPIEAMGEKGLLEWCALDPGSTNLGHRDWVAADQNGIIYGNSDELLREGLALAAAHNWRPSFAVYEPGFIRNGAAWAGKQPDLIPPIYRLLLSDEYTFGFPIADEYLTTYQRLLAQSVPDNPWMLAGYSGDVSPLLGQVVCAGGHVRVGLEDMPFGCNKMNVQLVEDAVRAVEAVGGEIVRPSS